MSYSVNSKTKVGSGCNLAILGWILLAAGLFFLSIVIFKDSRLAVFGHKTDGTIVKLAYKESGGGSLYTFEFTPEDSESITVETTATFGVALKVGDKVQVIYLPNQPKKAQIYSAKQLWMPLVVGFTVGSVCLVLGIYLIAVGRFTKAYSQT